MKRFLAGLALVVALVVAPLTVSAEGPTYLVSLSGTIAADQTIGTNEFSGTYLLGAQIPIKEDRSLFVAYRSIRFGAGDAPKSIQLGVVDYYDLAADWTLGIWLSGDIEVSAPGGSEEVNGLFGWSLEKPIGKSGLLKWEIYNTWTIKDGADYITLGVMFKVTPPIPGT